MVNMLMTGFHIVYQSENPLPVTIRYPSGDEKSPSPEKSTVWMLPVSNNTTSEHQSSRIANLLAKHRHSKAATMVNICKYVAHVKIFDDCPRLERFWVKQSKIQNKKQV